MDKIFIQKRKRFLALKSRNSVQKGAIISECGRYRFQLWRIWDETKPKVLFIMHNPSTADAEKDDPTIRRCIGFARAWGYGGIYVGNLFPYRATDPTDLLKVPYEELIPTENYLHRLEMIEKCDLYILAYGNPVVHHIGIGMSDFHNWQALKLTKAGNPCHPLYLKADLKPFPFA